MTANAIAACVAVDIITCGGAAPSNPEMFGAIAGEDAAIGFTAGGFIGARGSRDFDLKSALEGAVDGALFAVGYDCVATGLDAGSWQASWNEGSDFVKLVVKAPRGPADILGSAVIGGFLKGVFGTANNPWNDVRDGAIVGGITGFIGYSGMFGSNVVAGYLGRTVSGQVIFDMARRSGFQLSNFALPLGIGAFGLVDGMK